MGDERLGALLTRASLEGCDYRGRFVMSFARHAVR